MDKYLDPDFWVELGKKYYYIVIVVVAAAYGLEFFINDTHENDCINMCLVDERGPDYRFTPIKVLPNPLSSSCKNNRSSSHCRTRFQSNCVCYNQKALDDRNERDDNLFREYL